MYTSEGIVPICPWSCRLRRYLVVRDALMIGVLSCLRTWPARRDLPLAWAPSCAGFGGSLPT
eukprot:4531058-Pyramimonas_sp.AAC.1